MDAVLLAISEPHRREILRLVTSRELAAGEIAAHFDVSGPAISQHLRVLLAARLLTMRRDGTRRLYRARPQGLAELRSFIEQFWDESLLALQQAAEEEERKTRTDVNDEQRSP